MIDRRTLIAGGGAVATAAMLLGGRSSDAAPTRFPVSKTAAQWRKQLGPQRYHILREAGTERAGTSPLNRERRRGR